MENVQELHPVTVENFFGLYKTLRRFLQSSRLQTKEINGISAFLYKVRLDTFISELPAFNLGREKVDSCRKVGVYR